ncbi:fibronectin type III domain-containing protein [Aliikangiella coralliicola]|uniref:Fibronectin type-III domain-containing protein n=1 Tax=Aliikangiella coralliicola TaxID=2592383 RepID=A0A545UC16_9GAMM|nr:fibronectin type III domain-containing protein [Aliikangiella coralliicola]TQV87009.1 hypothetical protein FLL46_14475 [Aliikangiella coralliicola]
MFKQIKRLCLFLLIAFNPILPLGLSNAWANTTQDCLPPVLFSHGAPVAKQAQTEKAGEVTIKSGQALSNCGGGSPAAPGNIIYPSTSTSGSFAVSWDPSTGSVSQYRLEERKNSGAWVQVYAGIISVKTLSGRGDGSYQYRVKACQGANCSGYRTGNTTMTVRNKPSTPAAPGNINSTSTSYTVSWSKPSGSVTYYDVQERVGSGSWVTVASNRTSTSLSRSGKSNNTSYQYRVRACNQYSWSCTSYSSANSVKVELKPSTPSRPGNINSTSTSYTVSWSKPSGTVSYYDLQQRINGGSWSTVASGTTALSKAFSGKSNNTLYEYRVRACNSYSWACSAYSSAATVRVELKPSSVSTPSSINSTSTSYTVSWSKPSGSVDYYNLQQRVNGGSWTTVASDTTALSKAFSGKTDGSNYEYRVQACNSYSWACASYSGANSVKVRLKPSLPGAPTRPSTSTGSASISWTKPGGLVTYYDLQKRLNNTGSWQTGSNGVTTTSKTLSGLTDGVWDFRVRACNEFSWSCSSYSSASSDTTVRIKPSTPAAPSVPSTSTGSAAVTWSSTTNATYYDVQKRHNAGSWVTAKSGDTGTSETLSGLTDGSWDFRVRACNGYSWSCSSYSAASSASTVRAKPAVPAAPTVPSTSTGSAALNWSSVTNASYYDIQKRHNLGSWVTAKSGDTNLSETLSGLTDGSWDFRIRACNGYSWACSGYSTGISATTVRLKPAVPAAPTGPLTSTGSAGLNWSSVATATYYDVQKRNNSGSWITAVTGDTGLSETITGLTDGSWDYRVRACNGYSWACSSYSAASTSKTTVRVKPSAPALPTGNPATDTDGSYSINWVKPSGTVTVYDLQERVDNGSWVAIADDTTLLSKSVSGRASGDYDYRVRACNEFNWACSSYSGASTDTQVRRIPGVPAISQPTVTSTNDSQFQVAWNSVTEATYYTLQQRSSGGSWSTLAASQTTTNFNVTASESGVYEYRVKGCNEFSWACSSYSGLKSIVVSLAPDWALKTSATVADATLGTLTVPNNQTVGALEGNGGVSGGSATYTIPIALPPGRAGMQPSVGLSYSSRGGNGVAGVGWSLSVGGSISRCSATQAQDGFTSAPQYDATRDRLCLDGQRLIATFGVYGENGTEYRTEMDSFARITQTGGINATTSEFLVETKSGLVKTYGASTDSRHSAQGRSETLTWALTDVKDRSGNMMTYHYTNQGDGEYLLSQINYTGEDGQNGVSGRNGSDGNRQVVFVYEDREDSAGNSDYRTSFLAGGETRQTQRLKSVQTFYDSTIVRDYKLSYGNVSLSSGRTLLRSVQECAYLNSIESCLRPTNFDWQEAVPNYVFEKVEFDNGGTMTAANNRSHISELIPRGDIDGDGTRDWPSVDTDYDQVNEPGFKVNAERELLATHTEDTGICETNQAYDFSRHCFSADFNQDGKTDFNKYIDNVIYLRYSGSSNWVNTNIDLSGGNTKILSFSDFTGDGWPDIAVYEPLVTNGTPRVFIYPNSQNESAPFSVSTRVKVFELSVANPYTDFDYLQTVSEVGDMDGNGLPDFLVTVKRKSLGNYPGSPRPSKLILLHSQLNGAITFEEVDFTGYIQLGSQNWIGEAYFFHDINGDGLSDWLAVNTSANLSYKLNQGGSFESSWTDLGVGIPLRDMMYEKIPGEPEVYTVPIQEKTMLMDYDGDGKPELLYADSVVASSCTYHLHYPSSEWLCDEELWGLEQTQSGGVMLEPVDGGRIDISARNYKAIYFDEQADGSFATRVVDTDIIASPTERMALDVTGDGLLDVVTTFTCKVGQCTFNAGAAAHGGMQQDSSILENTVYINRNVGAASNNNKYEAIDVMKKVTNGLGVENHWTYRPLGSDEFDQSSLSFYDPDHDYVNGGIDANDTEHFHFGSNMMVVAEHKMSSGIGSLNATQYRYRGAVYNNQGRGFQGFRRIIVDNPTGIRAVTDFHQKFPFAGQIETAKTCLTSDAQDCGSNPITQTDISYAELTTANNSVYWIVPTSSVETTNDLNTRAQLSQNATTIDPNVDVESAYGNVTKSVTTIDNGFKTVTITSESSFDNKASTWWIGRLDDMTVTTKTTTAPTGASVYDSNLDPEKSIKTEYTYTNERLVDTVTVRPILGGGKVTEVDTDYNTYGLPISVKTYEAGQLNNARTVTTTYSNDGNSVSLNGYFPYQVTNNLGHTVTTTTYPEHGQAHVVTDVNGLSSTTEYDAFGRVQKITPPTGSGQPAYSRFAWCESGCDTVIAYGDIQYKVTTYSVGSPTTVEYKDQFNRVLIATTEGFEDNTQIYVRTEYDSLGRQTVNTIPSFSTSESKGTRLTSYDDLGRVLTKEVDQAHDGKMTVTYDYNGHVTNIAATDAFNKTLNMSRTYSGNGQLIQTTDALTGVTQYAYDAMGNPIVMQDANGNPIKAKYNALSQKLYVDDPNMGRKDFTYTSFGEVDTETDANNDVYNYDYDILGRLEKRYLNTQLEASFSFDTAPKGSTGGQCIGVPAQEVREDLSGGDSFNRSYDYDNYCRPLVATTQIDGADYVMSNQYDGNYGRVKAVTYPNGLTATSFFNSRGYLTQTQNAATGYIYHEAKAMNAQGQLILAEKANGVLTENATYTPETGQMTEVYTHTTNSGNQRHRIEYVYDGFGNLKTQDVETMQGSNVVTSIETYQYDDLHRLTQSSLSIGGAAQTPINYTYDAVGNLTSKDDYGSGYVYGDLAKSNGKAGPNAVRSVNKNNVGTIEFSYDDNGNLLTGDGKTMTYNAFNKPLTITKNSIKSTFYYGADQMRYKQVKTGQANGTETTIYIGKDYEVISYNGETAKKVYLGDAIITETESNIVDYKIGFVHRDRLNSVVTITNENGDVVDNKSYDPFGKPRKGNLESIDPLEPASLTRVAELYGAIGTGDDTELHTRRGFTDHEHLDDAELIHMNGRVYDYNLGRFLSVDPFIQEPGNSQSMNPYTYIMNNPLAGTDPSGYTSRIGGSRGENEHGNLCSKTAKGCNRGSDSLSTGNGAEPGKSNQLLKDNSFAVPEEIHPDRDLIPENERMCGFARNCSSTQGIQMFNTGGTEKSGSLISDEAYYGAKAACGNDDACKRDVQRRYEKEINDLRRDRPMDQLEAPDVVRKTKSKKANIRKSVSSTLKVKLSKVFNLVITSDDIDLQAAEKAGGFSLSFDTNGKGTIQYGDGAKLSITDKSIAVSKQLFKKINVSLKTDDSGTLHWSATAKLVGGLSGTAKGSLELDPRNGMMREQIEIMRYPEKRK